MLWTPSGNIVNDGLVLYLDAGIKGSYPGSGTTWTDLTSGLTASAVNGSAYTSINGGAIDFDGVNDRYSIPDNNNLDPGTNPFTVECWVRTHVIEQGVGPVDKRGGSGNGYRIDFYGGRTPVMGFRFLVVGNTTADVRSEADPLINTWYHLVGVGNGSAAALYINAAVQANPDSAYSYSGTIASSAPFEIGRMGGADLYCFNGDVAIVRYYNRALSAAEINQNFQVTRKRFGV